MFQAQLKGKLTRAEENLEDLLTSNVFGCLKYLPAEDGILPLLRATKNEDGIPVLQDLSEIEKTTYEFWPYLTEANCKPCEPDVLIRIETKTRRRLLVLVESKLLSGKSSSAPNDEIPIDQLAKEWDNLSSIARREGWVPLLIYITAHTEYPKDEIEESAREYSGKREKSMTVGWLSWRDLINIYQDSKHAIVQDMIEILKKQGLVYFDGFLCFAEKLWDWIFSPVVLSNEAFSWHWGGFLINWGYVDIRAQYIWPKSENELKILWRYSL